MMNRLRNGDLDALKVKAVLTNTQNREKKVKNEFKKKTRAYIFRVMIKTEFICHIIFI